MPLTREYCLEQAAYWQRASAILHSYVEHGFTQIGWRSACQTYIRRTSRDQRKSAKAARLARDYLAMAALLRAT